MKWRINLAMGGALLLFGALTWNLYRLQVDAAGGTPARAAAAPREEEARRGAIYFTDREGSRIPAAVDRAYPKIYAVPSEVRDPAETARALASVVERSAEDLEQLFAKPDDDYELLASKASDAQVEAVRLMGQKGIYVGEARARFYPFGPLAAHVLGFVGPSREDEAVRGRYGIESSQDARLRGTRGREGDDIMLTIDRNVQARAEEILEGLVRRFSATGGTVIVLEPRSGRIRAMGSYPDFDPNAYGSSPVAAFLNPAVEAIYEPGSIFKVITMAAAIESGAVTPETAYTDTGSLTLNGRTIRNWDKEAHGTVTMTEVIEESINTGAAFAARKAGLEAFRGTLAAIGIEEPTGVELPGEVKGSMGNLKGSSREIHLATASFGQGVSVTPLRLAAAIATLATGGARVDPAVLAGEPPRAAGRAFSGATAAQVTAMMVSAVEKAGVAAIPSYRVAGKTGTAQVPNFRTGGYTDDLIHSYAGFAPARDPRFLILLKLDKPQAELAGATVVPAFRELAQFLLNYYGIPPDNLPSQDP